MCKNENMKKTFLIIGIIILGAAAVILFALAKSFTKVLPQPQIPGTIVVDNIVSGETIQSPLKVTGKAVGSWYFEAVFPVELSDSKGKIIAQGQGHAQGDWMTQGFVPFEATLTFATPPGTDKRGMLLLRKDNPSGMAEHDQGLAIPVVFK